MRSCCRAGFSWKWLEADDAPGAHPYPGHALEYKQKVADDAPYLKDIHVYNPAGFVSAGVPVGDVPSMKRDIPACGARKRRAHDDDCLLNARYEWAANRR
ncbi:Oxidoreductase [Paraburkholderia caribensis MBA4]|uniref:Oxidoreductase n=1 Tax=Paraburkholderia caribensis MBA4 TaxID=1323664 RepID=A0A0P0RG19_9BURK|nr:Oxidoreductase [Paraburkholderia caribensis MBA4]